MDDFLTWVTQRAQPDLDWTYAMVTLVFRFFAVFVVLWLIQACMQIAAVLIRRSEESSAPAGGSTTSATRTSGEGPEPEQDGLDERTVAAIALALELESQPEAVRIAADRGTSAWAASGRAQLLRHLTR